MKRFLYNLLVEFVIALIILLTGFSVGVAYASVLKSWDMSSTIPTPLFLYQSGVFSANNPTIQFGTLIGLLLTAFIFAIANEYKPFTRLLSSGRRPELPPYDE